MIIAITSFFLHILCIFVSFVITCWHNYCPHDEGQQDIKETYGKMLDHK